MKGTLDYLAVNYYSSSYVSHEDHAYPGKFIQSDSKNGVRLGPVSGTSWQTVYAPGNVKH
jgi:beta-glucosidase/6-phospho-beta-glucosidase/beta-galactosidase